MPSGQKSLFVPGCVQVAITEFVCPSVRLSVYLSVVCVTFIAFTDCESCTRPISTNPASLEAGEYGLRVDAWDLVFRPPSRSSRGRRAAVDSLVYFGWGGFLRAF